MSHATAQNPVDPKDILIEDPSETDCNVCGKQCPSKQCLERHMCLVHNGYCDVCNQRIDNEDAEAHGLKHNGLKPVQCDTCFKLFSSRSGFVNHVTKDLMCLLCNKTFTVTSRAKHLRLHNMRLHYI
ncbi:unnamed protein product [Owenia fusiformis]|uniref:C2H2-type domain-containing protein n=1 Tax=Owenia fusiformis TaxID=6347 RepID=A0A8S4N5N0_OWEFU|nr:unnamed protein product [Owenia fusiformis]